MVAAKIEDLDPFRIKNDMNNMSKKEKFLYNVLQYTKKKIIIVEVAFLLSKAYGLASPSSPTINLKTPMDNNTITIIKKLV